MFFSSYLSLNLHNIIMYTLLLIIIFMINNYVLRKARMKNSEFSLKMNERSLTWLTIDFPWAFFGTSIHGKLQLYISN